MPVFAKKEQGALNKLSKPGNTAFNFEFLKVALGPEEQWPFSHNSNFELVTISKEFNILCYYLYRTLH